jgi:CheY-like chemotaxis protein
MKRLLVIEDGREYLEFAQLFLRDAFDATVAHCLDEALHLLAGAEPFAALLIDLHFGATPAHRLTGDLARTAALLFFGNEARALGYLRDEQGALILAALRARGYDQRALFVHAFGARRLRNLRALYGDVVAVDAFDAHAIHQLLSNASEVHAP